MKPSSEKAPEVAPSSKLPNGTHEATPVALGLSNIRRILARAKPAPTNGSAAEWETAGVCVPVQITESLFDEVIVAAGGRRVAELLSDEELNADYLVRATVFELKTLEEDGLLKEVRQERLADLFAPYLAPTGPVPLPTVMAKVTFTPAGSR